MNLPHNHQAFLSKALAFCLIFFSANLLSVMGQNFTSSSNLLTLSESEKNDLTKKAAEMLANFTGYVSYIGDKSMDLETKNFYIEASTKLFKPGAIMEVSSLYRKTHDRYSIKDYLQHVRDLKYHKVTITFSANAVYINKNSFERVPGTNTWKGVGVITQVFTGSSNTDGSLKPSYRDRTKKTVEVIFKQVSDYLGTRWVVLLGDVIVQETKKR